MSIKKAALGHSGIIYPFQDNQDAASLFLMYRMAADTICIMGIRVHYIM